MCNRTINTIASGGLNLALGLDKKKDRGKNKTNPNLARPEPLARGLAISKPFVSGQTTPLSSIGPR